MDGHPLGDRKEPEGQNPAYAPAHRHHRLGTALAVHHWRMTRTSPTATPPPAAEPADIELALSLCGSGRVGDLALMREARVPFEIEGARP